MIKNIFINGVPLGISFHAIPKNCDAEWLNVIKPADGWTPKKSSKVCSLHFTKEIMKITGTTTVGFTNCHIAAGAHSLVAKLCSSRVV